MILVVVFVHSVAADRIEIAQVRLQPIPDDCQRTLVSLVVHRIRPRHPYHISSLTVSHATAANPRATALRRDDVPAVVSRPEPAALSNKAPDTQTGAIFLNHDRLPRAVVLDAPDLDIWIMDVDPVVGKPLPLEND